MTPREPMVRKTTRYPQRLWDAAQAKADERGDVLSEVIRDALRRYVRSKK